MPTTVTSVTVLRTDADLHCLWPDWDTLWQQAKTTPFISPTWLRPWWTAFGTGQPVVSALHHDGRLLGVLPLYRLEDKLLPIGVGLSDLFDIVLSPDAPPEAPGLLLSTALQATGAERCDLPDLPETASLRHLAAPPGWRMEAWRGAPTPVLSLSPEPAVPKGMRRDLRQSCHRAERAGGYQVVSADRNSFREAFDHLVRLHAKRWQRAGEPGVLADPRVLAFHHAAGPDLLEAGLLRLQSLRLRGEVAAAAYALLEPGSIGFYLAGFDPDLGFESPGTILLGEMIGQAAREGRQEANFLRGNERYKYAWGAVDRWNTGRSFVRA